MNQQSAPLLAIKNVTKKFGGLTALDDISLQIKSGEIRGLIGPNGAGKSTLFKNIAGFYKPTTGEILYQGKNIAGKKPHTISTMGIVRTFQETTLFQELTVFENVLVGCYGMARANLLAEIFAIDQKKQQLAKNTAAEILQFMGLSERAQQRAAELPLGSQRALAMSIALATKPKLMLMDEPFAGMNPDETKHMMALTHKIQQSGITIILVEHDMKAVMGLCHYLSVLNFGQLLAQGTPDEIRHNDKVIEAYLGTN